MSFWTGFSAVEELTEEYRATYKALDGSIGDVRTVKLDKREDSRSCRPMRTLRGEWKGKLFLTSRPRVIACPVHDLHAPNVANLGEESSETIFGDIGG